MVNDKARKRYAEFLALSDKDREAKARSLIMESELQKQTIETLQTEKQRLADQLANYSKK